MKNYLQAVYNASAAMKYYHGVSEKVLKKKLQNCILDALANGYDKETVEKVVKDGFRDV